MPINRSFTFDMRKKEICAFILSYQATYDEVADQRAERAAQGFKSIGQARDVLGFKSEFVLPTFTRRFVDLSTRRGKHIRTIVIEDFGYVKLRLSAIAILGVRGSQPAQEQDLLDAFTATPLKWSDVDDAENRLVRGGIGIQDYQVDLVPKLEAIDRQDLTSNVNAFMATMRSQRDQNGRPVFDVKELERIERGCTSVTPAVPGDVVVTVGDPNKPGDGIRDAIRKENPQCEDLVTTEVNIGIAFKIPEIMVEWRTEETWFCGIKIGEMDVPHTFFRQSDAVLYGVIASPKSVVQVAEQVFRSCIDQAAVTTGILALVTSFSSISAAVTVFVAYVQQCLELQLGRVAQLECLFPDLKLVVAENVPWKEI